jgi:hypothetical protein
MLQTRKSISSVLGRGSLRGVLRHEQQRLTPRYEVFDRTSAVHQSNNDSILPLIQGAIYH